MTGSTNSELTASASRLSGGPATELLYLGLGLLMFIEVVVRLAARRSAALFAEPWTVRVTDEAFALQTAVSQAELAEFFARRLPPPKIRWYNPRSWR